jgi:hypothetical protein
MRVDPASYLEVSLRGPSIHTYSHTQQFPRIFCVNPWPVNADGGFLGGANNMVFHRRPGNLASCKLTTNSINLQMLRFPTGRQEFRNCDPGEQYGFIFHRQDQERLPAYP